MAESELEILHNLHLYHWTTSENIDLGSYWAYGSTNKTSIQICGVYIPLCNSLLYGIFSIKRGLSQEQQNMKSCQQKQHTLLDGMKKGSTKQTEQTSWDYVAVAKN